MIYHLLNTTLFVNISQVVYWDLSKLRCNSENLITWNWLANIEARKFRRKFNLLS